MLATSSERADLRWLAPLLRHDDRVPALDRFAAEALGAARGTRARIAVPLSHSEIVLGAAGYDPAAELGGGCARRFGLAVLAEGRPAPVVVGESGGKSRFGATLRLPIGVRSVAAVPLVRGGTTFGALVVGDAMARPFDHGTLAALLQLSAEVVGWLERDAAERRAEAEREQGVTCPDTSAVPWILATRAAALDEAAREYADLVVGFGSALLEHAPAPRLAKIARELVVARRDVASLLRDVERRLRHLGDDDARAWLASSLACLDVELCESRPYGRIASSIVARRGEAPASDLVFEALPIPSRVAASLRAATAAFRSVAKTEVSPAWAMVPRCAAG